MKRLNTLLVAIVLLSSIVSAKNVALMEIVTGAWCGWCPNGSVLIEQMEAKYGDQVIPIKFHTGDGMQSADTKVMQQTFGLSGVPAGTLNRGVYNIGGQQTGNVMNYSDQIIAQFIASEEIVQVTTVCNYNKNKNKFEGYVECKILKDFPYQLAFNALLCENDVTGTGSYFDQKNYFSGNDKYKTHPYYSEPALIKGYHHNWTYRGNFSGQVFGVVGKFPATVKAGSTYKWTFSEDVPNVPAGSPINIENTYVVGTVSVLVNGYAPQIINCSLAGDVSGGGSTITNIGKSVVVANQGDATNFSFEIENPSSKASSFNLAIENNENNPSKWLAEIKGQSTIIVGANSKATINITVYPGVNVGTAKYTLVATPKAGGENLKSEFTIIHSGAKNLYVYYDVENNSNLEEILGEIGDDFTDYATIGSSDFEDASAFENALNKFKDLETVIVSKGDKELFTEDDIEVLNDYPNNTNILLIGTVAFADVNDPTVKGYAKQLGFEYAKPYKKVVEFEVGIVGKSGDAITNELESTLVLDKYYPTTFNILDDEKVSPILYYKQDLDSICGIKIINDDNKMVVLGFSYGLLDDPKRLPLLKNIMNWLNNDVADLAAEIASDLEKVEFNSVEVGNNLAKELDIENKGKANLIISEIIISDDDENVFTLKDYTYPIIIEAGANFTIETIFAPKAEEEYNAKITITSNAKNTEEYEIPLSGSGIPNDVNDEVTFAVSLNITPNPVTENATLKYTLTDVSNVKISIMDINGRIINNLLNSPKAGGQYSLNINTNNLASGYYLIYAEINGKVYSLPMNVVK